MITGANITSATASLSVRTSRSRSGLIAFELDGDGTTAFATATTMLP